jgi:hypothetical protein
VFLQNKHLYKVTVLAFWVVAVHAILATMDWVQPSYSIRTAQFIAFIYLIWGLFFLFVNKFRMLMVCFGCSAAISFLVNEMTIAPNLKNREKKMWNQTDSILRQPLPFHPIPNQ